MSVDTNVVLYDCMFMSSVTFLLYSISIGILPQAFVLTVVTHNDILVMGQRLRHLLMAKR